MGGLLSSIKLKVAKAQKERKKSARKRKSTGKKSFI